MIQKSVLHHKQQRRSDGGRFDFDARLSLFAIPPQFIGVRARSADDFFLRRSDDRHERTCARTVRVIAGSSVRWMAHTCAASGAGRPSAPGLVSTSRRRSARASCGDLRPDRLPAPDLTQWLRDQARLTYRCGAAAESTLGCHRASGCARTACDRTTGARFVP